MDIQKRFEQVIEKYGHDIVYVRRNLKFHCECYSERSGGADVSKCPKCFGTGYKVSFEKTKVRRKITSVPESLVRARRNFDVGNVATTTYLYYMKKDMKPKQGDIVVEVEWRNGVPIKIQDKFVISVADPKQGLHGKIEFYEVFVRYETEGAKDKDALTLS